MYLSAEYLINILTEKAVAQLTDDVNGETINTDLINLIIANQSELIDNYLRGRYLLPLKNQHYILQSVCFELVKYELYKRRNAINDNAKANYKQAIQLLDDISTGKIILNEDNAKQSFSYTKEKSVYTNDL
jgi:phage gp36-like protein